MRDHPAITLVIRSGTDRYVANIEKLCGQARIYDAIEGRSDPDAPAWVNRYISPLDATALMGFLAIRNPANYIEIGSGNSTRFARHAIEYGGLRTQITSIDPQPRAEIDGLCDKVIRAPLEATDLAVFEALKAGDVVFMDGSHGTYMNTDTITFFFDVLPRLAPGVMVGIHDIFWPADYPPEWNQRYYTEQYVLGAMLLCPALPFIIELPCAFVQRDNATMNLAHRLAPRPLPGTGCSFWIETIEHR